MTKKELQAMAKALGVKNVTKLNKDVLKDSIYQNDTDDIEGYLREYMKPPQTNSPKKEEQPKIEKMKKRDLFLMAHANGIPGYDKMKIPELIEKLKKIEEEKTGLGLKAFKRRKIIGRGSSDSEVESRKEFNGKYIDLKKLKENILTIKYCKTGTYISTVKSQHINDDTKEVINDLINDKFDNRLFQKLPEIDRRLVKRVIKAFNLSVDDKDVSEDEYKKQYDILLGQFKSGNTSPLIKNKLKQYVVESMETGALTRREAWQLLFELANA